MLRMDFLLYIDPVHPRHLLTNPHAVEYVYLGGTKHDRTPEAAENGRTSVPHRGLQAPPAPVYPPPLPRGRVPPAPQPCKDPRDCGGF